MKRMVDTRGVAVEQVFLFIIAAITFALIMIFGYKAIADFIGSGEEVAFIQFKTDLESSIHRIYSEFGSVRLKEFALPAKYEQICFIDLDADYDADLCNLDPLACNVWERASDEGRGYDEENVNVFLTPPAPVPIKVFPIEMDNNYLCEEIVNGRFSLRLEGKGDLTRLGRVAEEGVEAE